MPIKDKTARNAYMRAYYAKNPSPQKRRVAARSEQVKAEIRCVLNAAKDVPCADCGVKYPPYVMDFDHVRGRKLIDLAGTIAAKWSIRKINEEIAKCEVVCSNCHRIRTYIRREQGIGLEELPDGLTLW